LDDKAPNGPEESCKTFLHGDPRNRWFDKSFSLIVTPNGQSAVNFEHSWGDGVAVLRYTADIYKDTKESAPIVAPNSSLPSPTKLEWNFSPKTKQSIRDAGVKADKFIKSLELKVAIFNKFGKDYFRSKSMSPDGAIQMAYQLAYNKMYGKTVSTYESASTAGFLHGRTEVVRPCSNLSAKFVETMKSDVSEAEKQMALKDAVRTHSDLVKQCLTGQGADRHLFALFNLAKKSGKIPSIFTDKAYGVLNHNILSTSTLSHEAIEGGGFGPVVADGYGIGYDASSDKIRFCVTSYHQKTEQFVNEIQTSLEDISKALEAKFNVRLEMKKIATEVMEAKIKQEMGEEKQKKGENQFDERLKYRLRIPLDDEEEEKKEGGEEEWKQQREKKGEEDSRVKKPEKEKKSSELKTDCDSRVQE